MIMLLAVNGFTSQVGLRWDENDPLPEGYRVFIREISHAIYDYDFPAWQGEETECTIDMLEAGISYAFVVRAFDGDLESEDSDEVYWTVPSKSTPPPIVSEDNFENEIENKDEVEDYDQPQQGGGQGGCFISILLGG